MINEELIALLQKQDLKMEVKIRHKAMTIANIDSVHTTNFCKNPSEDIKQVILLDNEELSKEGYR